MIISINSSHSSIIDARASSSATFQDTNIESTDSDKLPCAVEQRGGLSLSDADLAFFRKKIAESGCTPTNNMGVTEPDVTIKPLYDNGKTIFVDSAPQLPDDDGTELKIAIKNHNGTYNLVKVPVPVVSTDGKSAFIDQCSFTVYICNLPDGEDNAVAFVAGSLSKIFGFSATSRRDKGFSGYNHTYILGDNWGHLNYGGQNDTINVHITGTGCSKALIGWEYRLHDWLTKYAGRLTRADAAADFFNGEYSPEQAEQDYKDGKMSLTNRQPFAEPRGDWYHGRGGKTFYVGKRISGKLLRVYEKGKQLLGDIALRAIDETHQLYKYTQWVRVECEWHNTGRVIPLDILLEPGKYLAGAYPALSFISEVQDRIKTIKKTAELTVEKVKAVFKHQMGAWLYALLGLFGADVVNDLVRQKVPAWADINKNVPIDNIVDDIGNYVDWNLTLWPC